MIRMTRRLRFAVLAISLGVVSVLSVADRHAFEVVTSAALLVLPLVNWLAAALLYRAHRRAPEIVSLASRADDAIVLSLAATIGGVLGANRLLSLGLSSDVAVVLLALSLLLVSFPAIEWLRVWREIWAPRIGRRG